MFYSGRITKSSFVNLYPFINILNDIFGLVTILRKSIDLLWVNHDYTFVIQFLLRLFLPLVVGHQTFRYFYRPRIYRFI